MQRKTRAETAYFQRRLAFAQVALGMAQPIYIYIYGVPVCTRIYTILHVIYRRSQVTFPALRVPYGRRSMAITVYTVSGASLAAAKSFEHF